MALLEQARRSMPRGVPMAWMDDLYDHPPVCVSEGDGSAFTDVDGRVDGGGAQHGAHASYFFVPAPPTDGAGSRSADDPSLRALIRVFMANRGVWESGWWLGPTVSVAHDSDDVDRYVEVFDEFVAEVT